MNELFVLVDIGSPFSVLAHDAFESRLIVAHRPFVHLILRMASCAKIRASVIKRIVVDMIGLFSFLATDNFSMHTNMRNEFGGSPSIEAIGAMIPYRMPIPLIEPFIVGGINNGILTLRKRNIADRLIKWLRNGMAFQAPLGHVPTSIGICCAAILT